MAMAMSRWTGDLRQHNAAKRAFKCPVVHDVAFAREEGICETLEGRVPFEVGDAIMTGLIGEHWPIAIEYFLATYVAVPPTVTGSDGQYRKRKIEVWVMELQEETTVELFNGAVLSGVSGDWLVQYKQGSFGFVERDTFRNTYTLLDQ